MSGRERLTDARSNGGMQCNCTMSVNTRRDSTERMKRKGGRSGWTMDGADGRMDRQAGGVDTHDTRQYAHHHPTPHSLSSTLRLSSLRRSS